MSRLWAPESWPGPRGVEGLQCCQGWASPRQGELNSAWPVAPTTHGSVPPLTSPGEQCKSLSCLPSATLSLGPALGPSPLLTLTTERERERETWSAPLLCRLPPSRAQLGEQALLERCCWPLQLRDTEVNEARWFSYFPLTAQSAGACRPAMVQGGRMKEPSTVDRLSGRQLGSKKARRGGNR